MMNDNLAEIIFRSPLHYRGAFATFNKGWHALYMDVGSKRFLSVPKRKNHPFFLAALFIYSANTETNVCVEEIGGRSRALWRVAIKSKFPYIGLGTNAEGYKTLFVKAGFGRISSLKIEAAGDTTQALNINEVPDEDLITTLEDIAVQIKVLRTQKKSPDTDVFARFERSLLTLKSNETEHDVQALLIELYCIFRRNHRRAHKLLGLWADKEKQSGNDNAIKAFKDKLDTITFPLALGRHGFNPSFKNLNLVQVEHELHDLMTDLETMDVQPFLNSGTLLGYFRDGCPIPHDDDFDLGIHIRGKTEDEVAQNWRCFVSKVSKKYAIINKGSFVALKMSNGVQVDLFACWTLNDQLFVHPYCWADVRASSLIPMGVLSIRGHDFRVPADPEAVLSVNYGINWRVPDPFWRFDYRKSKRRFKGVLKKLKIK